MNIYTIGFTQKSAQKFFTLIKNNNIDLLLDIRLNNISQLAGFAKGKDLQFFLHEICNCNYIHDDAFAPTKFLLESYRAKKTSWADYEKVFNEILKSRPLKERFINLYGGYNNICLLCAEPTPEQCHRRLVAEYLKNNIQKIDKIIHI